MTKASKATSYRESSDRYLRNWNLAKVTLEAARAPSFAEAAARLGSTLGNVREQVSSLEDQLGAKVFKRRVRDKLLSDEGMRIVFALERMESAVEAIEQIASERTCLTDWDGIKIFLWEARLGNFMPTANRSNVSETRVRKIYELEAAIGEQLFELNVPGLLTPTGKRVLSEAERMEDAAIDAAQDDDQLSVPNPGPGPRFRLDERDIVERAPSQNLDRSGNDLRTIDQLKPLVQRCASELQSQLSTNEFKELSATVESYRISLDPRQGKSIDWGEVWGLGVMLENAASAAERKIAVRLLPPLEDPAKASLDSLLSLHAPMILATRDGARLSAAAQSFAMTREQEAELRTAAEQMAEKLADNEDVITPSAAKTVVEAIGTIGQGSHPERGTVYALATVKNLALVLVGGAAIATPAIIGAFLGSAMVGAAVGSPISLLLVEAVKKNAAFVALTSQLGARFEAMSDLEISRWVEQKASSLVPFRSFVLSNERALRKIAGLASELKWMLRYIDFMSDEDRKNLS